MIDNYYYPRGVEGVGSDIKWCNRWSSGKFCQLCKHRSKFDEWSQKWHWFYLLEWATTSRKSVHYWDTWRAEWQIYQFYARTSKHSWGLRWDKKKIEPHRYCSRGLSDKKISSLIRKGCKANKKCKCASIAQRGNWYCPACYKMVLELASLRNCYPHPTLRLKYLYQLLEAQFYLEVLSFLAV